MKNISILILLFIFLFSCSSYNASKEINIQSAKLAHSKFNNIKNNFSYEVYKSLIVEYGKNSKFPDIKN